MTVMTVETDSTAFGCQAICQLYLKWLVDTDLVSSLSMSASIMVSRDTVMRRSQLESSPRAYLIGQPAPLGVQKVLCELPCWILCYELLRQYVKKPLHPRIPLTFRNSRENKIL